MLLGFQKRFEPYILDGSKTHTIRAMRKRGVRVGEICHCYGGTRQKTMHLLGRWPCVKVEDIEIYTDAIILSEYRDGILVHWHRLSQDEREALARRDGFPGGFREMLKFWDGRLPFLGQIIHWDYRHPVREVI